MYQVFNSYGSFGNKLLNLLRRVDFKNHAFIPERFLWWSVFSTVAPMTLSAFRDLGFEFSKAVFGLQQRTPRWKSCTANVNANFGVALSYLYVKRHFDQTSREKVGIYSLLLGLRRYMYIIPYLHLNKPKKKVVIKRFKL